MDIQKTCQNYFNGFNELSSVKQPSTKLVAVLKILSYLTLVAPLAMGIAYGISKLANRIKKDDPYPEQTTKINRTAEQALTQNPGKSDEDPKKSVDLSKKVVLGQSSSDYRCGLHALKNAVAILKFWSKENRKESELNNDLANPKFFETMSQKLGNPNKATDLTIAELSLALPELAETYHLDLNKLSIINYLSQSEEENLNAGRGLFRENLGEPANSIELNFLTNYLAIRQKITSQEDFQHLFITGSAGHWSVIILEQKDNQLSWTSLDSLHPKGRENFEGEKNVISSFFPEKMELGQFAILFITTLTSFIGTKTEKASLEDAKAIISNFNRLDKTIDQELAKAGLAPETSEQLQIVKSQFFDVKEQIQDLIYTFNQKEQAILQALLPAL